MPTFLEPIYLNESMVMNCAAYILQGISSEVSTTEGKKTNIEGGIKAKVDTILNMFKASAEVNLAREYTEEKNLIKRYTVGSLHMSLVDELRNQKELLSWDELPKEITTDKYIDLKVILRPLDFYSIIEMLQVISPLIIKGIMDFGPQFNQTLKQKKHEIQQKRAEIEKYGELIKSTLSDLEKDYLKSSQLEMMMFSIDGKQCLGIVDIDVTDKSPSEIKAKLSDGVFHVIGKITRTVDNGENMSLFQRSSLKPLIEIIDKIDRYKGLLKKETAAHENKEDIHTGELEATPERGIIEKLTIFKPFIEQVCKLDVPGPVIRLIAMSICV